MAAVVGFSGKMGAGKSTAAFLARQYLIRVTGEGWTIVAFGDALKSIVSKMCGIPVCLCYSDVGKGTVLMDRPKGLDPSMFGPEAGMPSLSVHAINQMNEIIARDLAQIHLGCTLGKLLQIVGQAVRTFEPDFWVDALEGTMDITKNYIVEDVRYPNEFYWITESMDGVVGRVYSTTETVADGRNQLHQSEVALDGCTEWDFEIDNTPPYSSGKLMTMLASNLDKLMSLSGAPMGPTI
jgi:hypothetical protein